MVRMCIACSLHKARVLPPPAQKQLSKTKHLYHRAVEDIACSGRGVWAPVPRLLFIQSSRNVTIAIAVLQDRESAYDRWMTTSK